MASPVSAASGSQTTNNSASSASLNSSVTPSEEMFLNLLVAQIKNQDPLNPTDSTQFVSQLAQISQLEQVVGIRSDIEDYMKTQGINPPATQTTTGK
jgi:flagellar basal-body rod modification protein FlgD